MPSGSKATPGHSVASTPDLDSPMYSSSDLSDVTLSPVGGMALNTDILRKELRNKIYARRKSQGLEELTVEFKPPERTEVCSLIIGHIGCKMISYMLKLLLSMKF